VLIFLDHDQVEDDCPPAVLTFTEADKIRSALAKAIGCVEGRAQDDALAVELTLAYNIVRTAHDRRPRIRAELPEAVAS
jgi:hypothetical protein